MPEKSEQELINNIDNILNKVLNKKLTPLVINNLQQQIAKLTLPKKIDIKNLSLDFYDKIEDLVFLIANILIEQNKQANNNTDQLNATLDEIVYSLTKLVYQNEYLKKLKPPIPTKIAQITTSATDNEIVKALDAATKRAENANKFAMQMEDQADEINEKTQKLVNKLQKEQAEGKFLNPGLTDKVTKLALELEIKNCAATLANYEAQRSTIALNKIIAEANKILQKQ